MESLFSKNQNVKYLLCVKDVFIKHARFNPLKDKKGKTVLNAFIEIINESNSKPNTLWVGQRREFYNKFGQEWLDNNYILMYSTCIDGKSVIAERFIKTLKAKIYKNMAANNSKSNLSYLNKLVDHSINKKPINTDYSVSTEKIETNLKAPKFNINIFILILILIY